MSEEDKIPTSTIGILAKIIPDYYTRSEIDSLFAYAGAPGRVPEGNKQTAVQSWLRSTNLEHATPLAVLGAVLDDFMQKELTSSRSFWMQGTPTEHEVALEAAKQKVRETLAKDSLAYAKGGAIVRAGSTSTLSLAESVKKHGLVTVEIEINRALAQIEQDPHAAAQYAGNVLEAAIKAYLDNKNVTYGQGDTLAELWKLASETMGLKPKDWDDKDLKMIGSGLNSIVGGITHLRNKKSAAHGKSEEQSKTYVLKPRHARLAIHSAHTIAAYLIELIE